MDTEITTVSSEHETSSDGYTRTAQVIVVYENFMERQIIAAMFIIASILSTAGSGLVIVAVALSRKLRTTTNIFVVNLAVADLLTGLFMPWQAVAILAVDDWPIADAPWLCAVAGFVVVVTSGCSINSLVLIAINRWVGITKSRSTTRRIYTARKLGLMVIFSWGLPLCCALTPVLTDFGEFGYEKLYSTCTWERSNAYSAYYNILITVANYPIQTILIIFSYTSIFCYVRKTSRRMTEADSPPTSPNLSPPTSPKTSDRASHLMIMRTRMWRRQLNVTKNLLYTVLAFVVCLTPYFVAIMFTTDWSYRLAPWAGAILFCNSFVNPIIYATSHPDFKEVFCRMISCQKQVGRGGSMKRQRSTATTNSEV